MEINAILIAQIDDQSEVAELRWDSSRELIPVKVPVRVTEENENARRLRVASKIDYEHPGRTKISAGMNDTSRKNTFDSEIDDSFRVNPGIPI